VLLAFLMVPIVKALEWARVPEPVAIALSAVLLAAPLPSVIYLLATQVEGFYHDLPRIVASFTAWVSRLETGRLGQHLHLASKLDPARLMERLSTSASDVLRVALSSVARLANATSQIVLVFVLSILMVASRRHLRRCAERILSMSSLSAPSDVLDQSTSLIERFLLARFGIVLIVALVDSMALKIFGIPYFILLGTVMGVMTLLPAIGFILSVIPPVIVSFAIDHGFLKTFVMFLPLAGMSIADTYFFTPKWVGNRLNISSLTSFVGLLAGGLLWGVPGMVLSIPILGILRIAFAATPGMEPWGDLLADKDADAIRFAGSAKAPEERKKSSRAA